MFLSIFGYFSFCSFQTELLSQAEGVVKETSEYRCLQSQFSVLYNESLILKSQLDETRARLNTTRTARLRQLEHMEVSCMSVCVSLSLCDFSVLFLLSSYLCAEWWGGSAEEGSYRGVSAGGYAGSGQEGVWDAAHRVWTDSCCQWASR